MDTVADDEAAVDDLEVVVHLLQRAAEQRERVRERHSLHLLALAGVQLGVLGKVIWVYQESLACLCVIDKDRRDLPALLWGLAGPRGELLSDPANGVGAVVWRYPELYRLAVLRVADVEVCVVLPELGLHPVHLCLFTVDEHDDIGPEAPDEF